MKQGLAKEGRAEEDPATLSPAERTRLASLAGLHQHSSASQPFIMSEEHQQAAAKAQQAATAIAAQGVQRVPLSTAPLTTAQAGAIATFLQNPTWFATNQMSASELVELLARKKGGVRSQSTSMAYLRGQVQKAYIRSVHRQADRTLSCLARWTW